MLDNSFERTQNKRSLRNILIVFFAMLVFVVTIGMTLALRNSSTTGTITFNGLIMTEITDFKFGEVNAKDNPIIGDGETFLPTQKIKGVDLKVKVSRADSVDDEVEKVEGLAYVRCRLDISIENFENADKYIILEKKLGDSWKQITFSDGEWWVLVDEDMIPRGALNGEEVVFTEDNALYFDPTIPNEAAGAKVNITFRVESLQRKNIEPSRIQSGYWQSSN